MPKTKQRTIIALHQPSVTFWIEPNDERGQWVTASRFEGKLHVRGTYVDVSPQAEKLARLAYTAMENGFKSVAAGRERGILARIV